MLFRAPLSSGHAYLQQQQAMYEAGFTQDRLPGVLELPYNIALGKGFNPFNFAGPLPHEVSTFISVSMAETEQAVTHDMHERS